jgi:hypothetical protein
MKYILLAIAIASIPSCVAFPLVRVEEPDGRKHWILWYEY